MKYIVVTSSFGSEFISLDRMTNKFLCGRLILNKDGTMKRLLLSDGGGARECGISHIDIGFDEIHDRVREIFRLDKSNIPSKLYDFELKELDTNQYVTFFDYIQKNGLRFKGTLLYLCTLADNDEMVNVSSPEKRRTTQSVRNVASISRIPQVEADSSTPLVAVKRDDEPSPPVLIINEPPVIHRMIENLRISSFSNYSFEKSLNEFIDYLRRLIGQYHHETILIQLFEYICTIQGLSSIILDRIKQEKHSINEHEKSIYNDGLEKIENISRSIKALIELNKMKISHIDQQSMINTFFSQFHQNFKILREQWTSHRQSTSYTIDPPPPSTSRHHSRSRNQPESSSRHHSRSRNQTESSSRHYSETNSRKRTYRSTDNDREEKYSLFKDLLKSLDNLLKVLKERRFNSFYYLVKPLIDEIETRRSKIKLSDCQSLHETEQFIITIEKHLTNRMNDEQHHALPYGIHQELEYSFNRTLDSIRQLLSSLQYRQSQFNQHKRTRTSHHRSTPHEEKKLSNKKSNEEERIIDDNNDDQSSEASHSSIGDEVLMEVARDAYEQRPNRSK